MRSNSRSDLLPRVRQREAVFGNCIPPRFAPALNALSDGGKQWPLITHHRELFAPDAKDENWIPSLVSASAEWIIVSGDTDISRHLHEKKAWLDSGITAFFMGGWWGTLPQWEKFKELIRWWPEMMKLANDHLCGAGFLVNRSLIEPINIEKEKRELAKRIARHGLKTGLP